MSSTGFENLNKALKDAHLVVQREGVPRFYIRTLVELEDAVNGVARADTKKMSKTGATAYNRMRMNLKKNNGTYATQMEDYRAKPDEGLDEAEIRASKAKAAKAAGADSDSDEEEVVIGRMGVQVKVARPARRGSSDSDSSDSSDSSDDSSSDESDAKPAARPVSKFMAPESEEEESDDEFDNMDESESESEDDEDEAYKGLTGRARWVKREVVGKSKDEKAAEKDARRAEAEAKLKAKRERQVRAAAG